ncbi:MAG: carbohydrate porin [Brevundimonas sp.]|uniref:carbohydrate porin n=1 Tax=Brevundimonas sp. TaxID=1871086 RepID=UPI0027171B4C|nr:carbohydrate porin [Brevundimonas sp.]MDO9609241.1 carbohydrate porin [Brevundimonas sp.]
MQNAKPPVFKPLIAAVAATCAALGAVMGAAPAQAQDQARAADPDWTLSAEYTADVSGVVSGGAKRAGRYLDNLSVELDGDLEQAWGWRRARLHLSGLYNGGGEPNALAGTLQGVDNIEVGAQGARLFEAWIEQDLGGSATLLAGLYDLNSEFYATEASGLLLSPPFGIGSELASTGPNGPAIFPSSSLAARLRVGETDKTYVQFAVVNADARTIGDHGGVDTDLDHGVLAIAEVGSHAPVGAAPIRYAIGVWRYNQRQDHIRDMTPDGDPVRSIAQGAYALAEGPVWGAAAPDGPQIDAFARLGVSDGDTTDFKGGWQAGLLVRQVFAARPDSQLSFGVHQGWLSSKARANLADTGAAPDRYEEGLELTYADRIGRFTIQPDVQLIRYPGGLKDADDVVVVSLRVITPLF